MDLPKLLVKQQGEQLRLDGTWYRGDHTNFLPSKAAMAEPASVVPYIMHGWTPDRPFIDRSSRITAFGSCFAAHISNYLHAVGYNVLGRHLGHRAHIIRSGEGMVNTFAVRQQLEWALAGREFKDYLWIDERKQVASMDPAIRTETSDIIQSTDVFIITLGLSEIWYDKESGEAFWRAIPANLFDPERHGFRVSTVQENTENLDRIYDLIRSSRPGAKIVLTLSPVPLLATFRPISCLTANSVSKAILRVAIDEFIRSKSDDDTVFYFPSYEIIKDFFTDPFKEDNRHPKLELVEFVMRVFQKFYCM